MSVSNYKRLNKTHFPSFLPLFPSLFYWLIYLTRSRIYSLLTIIFIFPEIIPIPFLLLWMEDILLTEEPVSNVFLLDLVDLSFTQMLFFILVTIKMVS